MNESVASIQKIVGVVSSLAQNLARGDKAKQRELATAHLRSMLQSLSGFEDRDEEAIEELKKQIEALDS